MSKFKKDTDNKMKNNKKAYRSSEGTSLELIPILRYDYIEDCFICKKKTTMDFIQIKTNDLKRMAGEDVRFLENKMQLLFKTFSEDIKLISLNFPCNTQPNQRYFERKLSATKNPALRRELEITLKELIYVDNNHTTKEFYLMFKSSSLDQHKEHKNTILSCLGTGKDDLAILLDPDKKVHIVTKLENMNMTL